jgi:hypothetical protein
METPEIKATPNDPRCPLDSLVTRYGPSKFIDLIEELMHLLVKLLKYEPGQHEAVAELHLLLLELSCALRGLTARPDGD